MKTLHEHFSVAAIITELCRERIKLMNSRHQAHYLHRISSNQRSAGKSRLALSEDLEGHFPSSKAWRKFRQFPKRRNEQDPHAIALITLRKAVWTFIHKSPDEPWVKKLLERVERIRSRALLDPAFSFSPPLIVGALKKPKSHQYRPISIYGTDDKIIEKITARYLRERLDPLFSESSLAYRARRGNGSMAITHHDALFAIANFLKEHSNLSVTEADYCNFMDSISHDVARDSLDDLILQGRLLHPEFEVESRALQIYDAYLASYSFKVQVLGQGLAALRKMDKHATFSWPEDALREMHGENDDLTRIGIPQGGAMSCLITNIVLNDVDRAVERVKETRKSEMLYQRYCDDMIALSPEKVTCQLAMEAYQAESRRKKLPMHKPEEVCRNEEISKSKSGYWDLKSKLTYSWSGDDDTGIPWIQFVGYQIKYDGKVRIRNKTLSKHTNKMTDLTNKLLDVINPRKKFKDGRPVYADGLRMSREEILHSFQMKLVSMAVGRRTIGQPSPTSGAHIMPMCWAHGFKPLWEFPFNPGRLKELDRHLDRQLRRIRCRLQHYEDPPNSSEASGQPLQKKKFCGAPVSLYYQFAKSTKSKKADERSEHG